MSSPQVKAVSTPNAPISKFPLSQAIIAGCTMYISGQVGLDPTTNKIVEGGVEPECRQVLANLGEILKAAGASYKNVVKTTVLLADMNDFLAVNKIYGESKLVSKIYSIPPNSILLYLAFTQPYPARAAYQVAALPLGCRVEIEAIAVIGEIN